MSSLRLLSLCLLPVLLSSSAAAQKPFPRQTTGDPYAHETRAQRDARMAWWREAKFGMFIHWGVYAVPAGVYEDVRDAEWLMRRAEIPVKVYRDYARQFTAENYDPQAWVDLAKKAGMRYMVLTSKHHDGFALYPTAVSDWDVLDASPAKRDLIEPLAKAARAGGIKFGLYYSHSQDWVHPGGAKWKYEEGGAWDEAHKGSYDDYLRDIAVPQVREILTRYQPDVLWWDTPHHMTPERSKPLAELLSLCPGIIHNDRLGGGYPGDTVTPENYIPPAGYEGDWETCMVMNDNWGYTSYDHNWKSTRTLVFQLIDVVSKGGNYLLNVGPDRTGRIPQPSIDRLTEVGKWMEVNGEAIYGTSASPFSCRLPWGRVTTKADGEDTLLYLHVLDWPADGRLLLPGLRNQGLTAGFLGGEMDLAITATPHGPVLQLPLIKRTAEEMLSTTLKVRFPGEPKVDRVPVLPDGDGTYRFTPTDAQLQGGLSLGQSWGLDRITVDDPKGVASWNMEADRDGEYRVVLWTATREAGPVLKVQGVGDFTAKAGVSEKWRKDYHASELGTVRLKKGEKRQVTLRPVEAGWQTVNVHQLELLPVK